MKRYFMCSSPYEFVKYTMEIAKDHERILRSLEDEYYGPRREYELIADLIHVKEVPLRVEHVTVPAVAFYDFDDEVIVEVGTTLRIIERVPKAYGYKWVPLWINELMIFQPETDVVVKPKPRSIIVVTLKPKGEKQ